MKKLVLYKLGDFEHRIFPSKGAFNELKKIIKDCLDAKQDVLHLVWGPELSIEVYDIPENAEHKLIESKHEDIAQPIYELGVNHNIVPFQVMGT